MTSQYHQEACILGDKVFYEFHDFVISDINLPEQIRKFISKFMEDVPEENIIVNIDYPSILITYYHFNSLNAINLMISDGKIVVGK